MSKEHAYAYEAGYRDGSAHYELEHCPACKNVADLQEALDENAKLLKELEAEHALAETLGHYHEDAKAENAELRKLVRGLDYCSDELNSAECDRCPLHDATDENLEPKCVRMMRELGIEGDE